MDLLTIIAYAVEQAMLTASKIQNGHGKVELPSGDMFEPKHFMKSLKIYWSPDSQEKNFQVLILMKHCMMQKSFPQELD